MLTNSQGAFLRVAAYAAAECERVTQVPAEQTLAQAILESYWGARKPGNNCFGIKYVAKRHAEYQECETIEILRREDMRTGDQILAELQDGRVKVRRMERFATFPSLADCFTDHNWIISHGHSYRAAWQRYLNDAPVDREGAVIALMRRVAQVYATDSDYFSKLIRIISMPEVRDALAEARMVDVPANGEAA